MTGPVAVLVAAVMALTALSCAGRLAVAPLSDRVSEPVVDLVHVAMGTVMAAMLLGLLNRRWDVVWVVGFASAGLWFVRAAVVGARHHLQHGAACLAMVVMLVGGSSSVAVAAPSPAGRLAMSGMAMSGSGLGSGALPGAALVVVLAAGLLALATVDAVRLSSGGTALAGGAPGRPRPLAPRCAAGCRVAMAATMGLALLTML